MLQELAAIATQLNKLFMGEWMAPLLDDPTKSCCYVADGGESLQSEWLASLLTQRGADGKIDTKALDLSVLKSKTADAQAARFTAALDEIATLCEEAGVVDAERAAKLRSFRPSCSCNDRAANARKAARIIVGLEEGDDDPTCAEHALVNILEEVCF